MGAFRDGNPVSVGSEISVGWGPLRAKSLQAYAHAYSFFHIFDLLLNETKIFHFRPAVAFEHNTGGNRSDI